MWSQKLKVMKRYDLTAHIYDMRYAEEQNAKIKAALEKVEIKKHSSVLDIGCGTGLLFDHVANKARMVIGLDVSKKILHEARKRAEKFGSVHLIWADADYLPFKDGIFSHIFAITLLQNMPFPEKTLNEALRTAGEDAVIVATGLKKKFSMESFKKLLLKLNLNITDIMDNDENMKCYVAICTKIKH